MYKIVSKKELNANVVQMEIEAPLVARKAKAGQFIILRVDALGERIPLTIAGCNDIAGTVKIIFQKVGATTLLLGEKNTGEYIEDFVGPLGSPTNTDRAKKVCIVSGGVGAAIAMPVAQEFYRKGAKVTSIVGFRSKDLLILEAEFKAISHELCFVTDDGSFGEQGNVTVPLKRMLEQGADFDEIITIGPLIMMKFVVEVVRPYGVPVTVSMNPIMIDGTGMCGGCRLVLNVNGEKITKFACVDGPDFDGYQVDFDDAMSRSAMYRDFERHNFENVCNLLKKGSSNLGN